MTQTILIDGVTNVTIANGVVRVDCVALGPNNEPRMSGTLVIPASQTGTVLQTLVNAMQELQRIQAETMPTAGNA